jgi:hypothetical protein
MAALVPEMISNRLFNSLVAAVGSLAGAALSEWSLFMKRKYCVVESIGAISAGTPLNQ